MTHFSIRRDMLCTSICRLLVTSTSQSPLAHLFVGDINFSSSIVVDGKWTDNTKAWNVNLLFIVNAGKSFNDSEVCDELVKNDAENGNGHENGAHIY